MAPRPVPQSWSSPFPSTIAHYNGTQQWHHVHCTLQWHPGATSNPPKWFVALPPIGSKNPYAIAIWRMKKVEIFQIYMYWWSDLYGLKVQAKLSHQSPVPRSWSYAMNRKKCGETSEVPEASRRFNFSVKQLQRHHVRNLEENKKWRLKWCQNMKWTYIWILPERRYGGFQLPC